MCTSVLGCSSYVCAGRADNASLLEAGTVLCIVPKWRNVLRVEGDRRCANDVQLRDDMT